jgi:hypothetical protein
VTTSRKIKLHEYNDLKNIGGSKKLGTANAIHLASGMLPVKGPKK